MGTNYNNQGTNYNNQGPNYNNQGTKMCIRDRALIDYHIAVILSTTFFTF